MCYTIKPDLFVANYLGKKKGTRVVKYKELYELGRFVEKQFKGKVFVDLCSDSMYDFQLEYKNNVTLYESQIKVTRTGFWPIATIAKKDKSINWRLPKSIKTKYLESIDLFIQEQDGAAI